MQLQEFTIKKLGVQDLRIFQTLIFLLREVYEMENAETAIGSYLEDLLANPGFIVFVAMQNQEVVGGLTAHVLPMVYACRSEVYLYDIGVKAQFLRKGAGRKLISSLIAYCSQKGINEIFVDADERDRHAVDFYQATGGKALKVVNFTYSVR